MERAMAHLKLEQDTRFRSTFRSAGSDLHPAVLIVPAAVPVLLILWLVPPALVLPTLSAASFVFAVSAAALAYNSGVDRRSDGITLWDVAGGYAMIWVGAGILSDPEHVIGLFDQILMAR
jgi:hypothetical protein